MTCARRVLSIFGCAAFTAALWGQAFHLAVVRHVICADHGELVEQDGSAAHGSGDAPADPDRHDHCPTLSAHAYALASAPTWVKAPGPVELGGAITGVLAFKGARAVPLLRVAPKTSPPHARDT